MKVLTVVDTRNQLQSHACRESASLLFICGWVLLSPRSAAGNSPDPARMGLARPPPPV